jgi:HEAT repeat protein
MDKTNGEGAGGCSMNGHLVWLPTRIAIATALVLTAGRASAESRAPFGNLIVEVDSLYTRAASGGTGLEELEKAVTNKSWPTSVRQYAIEKIGELAKPEADNFLIQISSNTNESVLMLAARIAYLNSRVIREPSQAGKMRILLETLNHAPMRNTRSWAADELCDMGDAASLPQVRKTISDVDPFPSGKKRFNLCESKVRLLAAHTVRIDALKAALLDKDEELRRWGIQQLGKLKTPDADTALVNFAGVLQKNPLDENERLLNLTVHALTKRGWDDQRFKAHGIESRGGLRMPKRNQGKQ